MEAVTEVNKFIRVVRLIGLIVMIGDKADVDGDDEYLRWWGVWKRGRRRR